LIAHLRLASGFSSTPFLYHETVGVGRPWVSQISRVLVLSVAAMNVSLGSMVGGTKAI